MSVGTIESFLVWTIIFLYAGITILMLVAFIFNKERLLDVILYPMVPAFAAHTALFIMRWHMTGYFPANGEYENSISSGWFAVLLTLYLFLRRKGLRGAGLIAIPATLFFLGYGVVVNPGGMPLNAAQKSPWLIVHVLFAQIAYGAYFIACGLGLVYLLKDNREQKGLASPFYSRFPALPILDETMFKFAVLGFITDAVMIAAGSIWAKDLWGNYWSWDPVEVWSLVSWLIYGIVIHLRVTLGWKGRRLAWVLIFAVFGFLITYWGVDIVVKSTQHVFGVTS